MKLFPFGYGLSYTTFTYGEVTLDRSVMSLHDTLRVSVPVTNTGTREGAEVVQLYIRDKAASLTRPVKELKGFQKIKLKPGETRTVVFAITREHLSFYNQNLQWVCEPGDFEVMVGGNSADVRARTFTVNEATKTAHTAGQ
jgi:beta-glucosidase